jgi:hypothetical protein
MKRIIALCGAALVLCSSQTGAATLGEALNATYLTWTTGGNDVWRAQYTSTHDGLWAAKSKCNRITV